MPDVAIQIQIRAQRAHRTCSLFTVHYSLCTKKRIDCTRKGYAASVRRQSRQRLRSVSDVERRGNGTVRTLAARRE